MSLSAIQWFPFDPQASVLLIGGDDDAARFFCGRLRRVGLVTEFVSQEEGPNSSSPLPFRQIHPSPGEDLSPSTPFDYVVVWAASRSFTNGLGASSSLGDLLRKASLALSERGAILLVSSARPTLELRAGEIHLPFCVFLGPGPESADAATLARLARTEVDHLFRQAGMCHVHWYLAASGSQGPVAETGWLEQRLSHSLTPSLRQSGGPVSAEVAETARRLAGFDVSIGASVPALAIATRQAGAIPSCLCYWPGSPSRAPGCRLEKRVEKRGSGLFFIRSADTPAANAFLQAIEERERLAADKFDGYAHVVNGRREGESLVYDFVDLPNLEEQVALSLQENDPSFGVHCLLEYKRFLERFPYTRCVPSDFCGFFGWEGAASEPEQACLTFAPCDCIPRNIIVRDGLWEVLDLEWTFPFPLPREFLIWRGVFSVVEDLQYLIRRRVSPASPLLLYRGYGAGRVYLPAHWYESLKIGDMDLKKYAAWECLFTRRAVGRGSVAHIRLKANPRYYSSLPGPNHPTVLAETILRSIAHLLSR